MPPLSHLFTIAPGFLLLLGASACTAPAEGSGSQRPPLARGTLVLNDEIVVSDYFRPTWLTRMIGTGGDCGDGTWAVLEGDRSGMALWFEGAVGAGAVTELPSGGMGYGGALIWEDDADPTAQYRISGQATLVNWSADRITVAVTGQEVIRSGSKGGSDESLEGTKWSLTLDVADQRGTVDDLGPTQAHRCASPATGVRQHQAPSCSVPNEERQLDCSCFVDASGNYQATIVDVDNPSCQPYEEGSSE